MAMRYDLIVLGAGSAARDGANKAAREYDAKVALVESTRWGGSCPNVACKPTKAYLVVADLVHDINRLSETLGIEVGEARIDLPRVKARKDALKTPQPKWVENLNGAGFDTYDGEAALVGPHAIRVEGQELSTERILIATGSRTAVPPIPGIDEVDWVDHVSALELTELPEALLVVGGGPVGLEFAQAFSRFGSRVTVVQSAPGIAPRADQEAAAELASALTDEGIELLVGSSVERFARKGNTISATLASGDSREISHVLLASGRVPNIEALGLDDVGIEQTRSGITVDDRMRTSVPGIWAAGDVAGRVQLTPIAQYEARIAIDDMFGKNGAAADYSVLPTTIFTDPELAGVGLTEQEAREQGLDYEFARHDLKEVQRAAYTETKRGLFKLIYERKSRRVTGLHIVARGAGDIVQSFALAIKLGATVDDFAQTHHAFPTIGEGVKAAAEKAIPARG